MTSTKMLSKLPILAFYHTFFLSVDMRTENAKHRELEKNIIIIT